MAMVAVAKIGTRLSYHAQLSGFKAEIGHAALMC